METESVIEPTQNNPTEGITFQRKIQPKIYRRRKKRVIPTVPEKFKTDLLGKERKYNLSNLNPFITCPICQGYMIDATTITECLHSFCRSCIVMHLKKSFYCPLCNELVHKTNPWYNLRSDGALSDIVEKLVPGLGENEERRRKVFYTSRGLAVPEKVVNPDPPVPIHQKSLLSRPLHGRRKKRFSRPKPVQQPPPLPPPPPKSPTKLYHVDDQVTMQLELKCIDQFGETGLMPLKRKFVRCSAHVTVGLLQKFIARKLKLDTANQIEILCCDTELGTDFTLHYIKETMAAIEDSEKPLLLHYGLTQLDYQRCC